MGGLSSQDFERLRISIDDLTRADRELVQANDRARGVGDMGPVRLTAAQQAQLGGAAVTSVAGAAQTSYWQTPAGQLSTQSTGMALSATRQVLSSAGFGAAGALAGGLAGGPVGLASAAIGVGGQFLQDRVGVASAALGAYANSPTSDTESMAKARAGFAGRSAERDFQGSLERQTGFLMGMSGKDVADAAISRAQVQRQDAQETQDRLSPEENALARTRGQLEGFARVGGMRDGPGGDAGRRFADEMYHFNLEQARNAQDFEKWARVRDVRMSPGAPGAQGRLGPR